MKRVFDLYDFYGVNNETLIKKHNTNATENSCPRPTKLINEEKSQSIKIDSFSNISKSNPPKNAFQVMMSSNSRNITRKKHETIYFVTANNPNPPYKFVAGFDLDSTLVEPKSNPKFARNASDWQWLDSNIIPEKLRQLHKSGFIIIVFTNQKGVTKGKVTMENLDGRITQITNQLDFPIYWVCALDDDKYRKPNTGMWEFLSEQNIITPDAKDKSIFVGDAAGGKNSFGSSDLDFALNLGIKFYTPDEYFFGKTCPYSSNFEPSQYLEVKVDNKPNLPKHQEMIIFVGCPGSGKSTYYNKYLKPNGYIHINQDILILRPRCIAEAKMYIMQGKSVVIDNTSPSVDKRAEYISIAKSRNIPVRCFFFDTPRKLAEHMNCLREFRSNYKIRKVPKIAYNIYQSKFKPPSNSEGFTEVVSINFSPIFDSEAERLQFLRHFGS